jgi:RNA polymerase sigma-70 factor (ECF subfamily)
MVARVGKLEESDEESSATYLRGTHSLLRDGDPAASIARSQLVTARAAWPSIGVANEVLLDALVHRSGGDSELLGRLQAADLLLALGVAGGDQTAIEALVTLLRQHVPVWVQRLPVEADEVTQRLLERLLRASPESEVIIERYEARVPLLGWLRVVATRIAVDVARSEGRASQREARFEAGLVAATEDPELERLRARYGEAFRTAAREALPTLTARARTLLLLHYVEGVTVDSIAVMYGVHRVTLSRWLAAARGDLEREILRRFRETAQLSADECASVLRALGSNLSISLGGLKRE